MDAHANKPETIRELGPVDITAIKALVGRISENVWTTEDAHKENKFACFHDTQHIIFRFIEGLRDHRVFYSNPIWLVWQAQLLPLFDRVVAPYGLRSSVYPKVMLAKLAAGEAIDRHTDGAGANLFTHKIHIPLQTNENVLFMVQDQTFHLQEGHAYEVNNIVPHAAENRSATDRIHLIFEVFDGGTESGEAAAAKTTTRR